MTCVVCRNGELRDGSTTITLERDQSTFVFKHVPALVCDVCGERYVDDDVTSRLLEQAEAAMRSGIQVEVRTYTAA